MRGLFRKFGKHPRNEETPGAGNPPVDNSNAKRVVRITLPDYTGIPVRSPVPPYDPHAKIQVKRSETHKEPARVVEYLKERYETQYDPDINDKVRRIANGEGSGGNCVSQGSDDSDDELFNEAVRMVLQSKGASVSMLQRRLRIGYPRAGNLIDDMEKLGIVGPIEGSKPRRVLITETEWLEMQAKNNE